MTNPLEIVNRFFALTDVKGRNVPDLLPAIRDMLTEDFAFTGPLMKTEGREQYVGLLGRFLLAHVGYRFHHQFTDGSEVCSIYLLREGMLELFATRGLNQSAVHVTRMAIGEGLVGMIAENV